MPIYGFEANKITCMVSADYYIVLKFWNKIHENIKARQFLFSLHVSHIYIVVVQFENTEIHFHITNP